MFKPLKTLENWMIKKEKDGKGLSSWDGNGSYFWDFETMKMYSPFDDELLTDDRSFEIEEQEPIVQEEYQKYKQNLMKKCSCSGFQLLHYGCCC